MSRFSWRRRRDELPVELPVDVYPCSNGEFLPERVTAEQRAVMALADEHTELVRERYGISRREFVRSAGAFAIGLWAIDQVMGSRWGSYSAAWADNTKTNAACDLEWPGAQGTNLPGEFIFDVQSHHVESDGQWRVTNPSFALFFAAVWTQAGGVGPSSDTDPYWLRGDPTRGVNTADGFTATRGGREVDPIENLSRYHYLKEVFLDSSTNMAVLSAVPSEPRNQPLPIDKAAFTVDMVNRLAASQRCVMHAFVMPNRGALGRNGAMPTYASQEFEMMERHAALYGGILHGWKTYCPWGEVPYASGWHLDSEVGLAFLEQVRTVSEAYGVPPVVATHKGFALPGFDQQAASARDVGPAAAQNPGVRIIVYHSGYDSETVRPYPGDDAVNSSRASVDTLIRSLRAAGIDAPSRVPAGLEFGNAPNVYAEIGSTWRSVMRSPDEAAHLLGKLITHVGPRRICWGTDSLWYGSPQSEIVAFRAFTFSQEAKDFYKLPYGLDGDADDPTRNAMDAATYVAPNIAVDRAYGPGRWPADGAAHPERSIRNAIFGRNAAEAYGIDADAARHTIGCDDVQKIRDGYLINQGTPMASAPLAPNQRWGFRTAPGVLRHKADGPWAP